MTLLGVITARAGSKRIPGKNIKDFFGKPVISYAINACLSSGIFDTLMVSTDDEIIAKIARKSGAEVPFLRSSRTSNDFSSTFEVLEEVINEYEKLGKSYDDICCVYPCSPFLKPETLAKAYEKFLSEDFDSLVPVVRYSFPVQRAYILDENGYIKFREPEFSAARSQDLEPVFHDAGMFYFSKKADLLKNKKLTGARATYLELDELEVQDIDNLSDWKMAELKYKVLNSEQ